MNIKILKIIHKHKSLFPLNILMTFEKMSAIKLSFKLDLELRLIFEVISNSVDFVPRLESLRGVPISY